MNNFASQKNQVFKIAPRRHGTLVGRRNARLVCTGRVMGGTEGSNPQLDPHSLLLSKKGHTAAASSHVIRLPTSVPMRGACCDREGRPVKLLASVGAGMCVAYIVRQQCQRPPVPLHRERTHIEQHAGMVGSPSPAAIGSGRSSSTSSTHQPPPLK